MVVLSLVGIWGVPFGLVVPGIPRFLLGGDLGTLCVRILPAFCYHGRTTPSCFPASLFVNRSHRCRDLEFRRAFSRAAMAACLPFSLFYFAGASLAAGCSQERCLCSPGVYGLFVLWVLLAGFLRRLVTSFSIPGWSVLRILLPFFLRRVVLSFSVPGVSHEDY